LLGSPTESRTQKKIYYYIKIIINFFAIGK
jgi:hypothetical protein